MGPGKLLTNSEVEVQAALLGAVGHCIGGGTAGGAKTALLKLTAVNDPDAAVFTAVGLKTTLKRVMEPVEVWKLTSGGVPEYST